jgi:hypothetical protein
MKLNTTANPVQSSLQNTVSSFNIKTTAKAFKILSDGLYKNKILAFVRELSRNAYDAHIAAGRSNIPFEIHLPSQFEPTFYVKDFGTGLSEENVMSLYTTYFDSSKTDSNDYVGALGLGSKSPFSYRSKFTVKSRYDGIEKTYSCFLNEQQIPSIVKMGEVPYTGLPGLEVEISINREDFNNVSIAVKSDLLFWEGTLPKVIGNSNFVISRPKKVLTGTNWYTTERYTRGDFDNTPVAVQGHVGYPISLNILHQKANEKQIAILNLIKKINPVIQFPIGQLDVTASREELSYDETTINNIISACTNVIEEFTSSFKSELKTLDSEKTEIDFRKAARKILQKYVSSFGSDFISFYSEKIPSVVWNKKEYSLIELFQHTKNVFIQGHQDCLIYQVLESRGTNLRKNLYGQLHVIPTSKISVEDFIKRLNNSEHIYGVVRNMGGSTFSYWDKHKKSLPRAQRDAKNSFDNHMQTMQSGKALLTQYSFYVSHEQEHYNARIFLNDQKALGFKIVSKFVEENRNTHVFIVDYNAKKVSSSRVAAFVKQLTSQLTGLKILTTSQIVLKNPIVNTKVNKALKDARSIDSCTVMEYTTNKKVTGQLSSGQLSYRSKTFNYAESSTTLTFPVNYDISQNDQYDFSKGDFYYFYEIRNKHYLDEEGNSRISVIEFLTTLQYLGILNSTQKIVSLRPATLKRIQKNKKSGKMIEIKTLYDKMVETIMADKKLTLAYCIGTQNLTGTYPTFLNSVVNRDIIDYVENTYGKITSSKMKCELINVVNTYFQIKSITLDEHVSRLATLLSNILYMSSSNDKVYTDLLTKLFRSIDTKAQVESIKVSLQNELTVLNSTFPLVKMLNTHYYDLSNKNYRIELFNNIVDYVQMTSSSAASKSLKTTKV